MASRQYIIATPNGGVAVNETSTQEYNVYGTQVSEASLPSGPTTLNPYDKSPLVNLTNGNLTADGSLNSVNAINTVRSTTSKASGKYYAEFTYSAGNAGFVGVALGIANANAVLSGTILGGNANGVGLENDGYLYYSNLSPNIHVPINVGHVIGMAVDFSTKKIWYRVDNGLWDNTTDDPATNTGGTDWSVNNTGPYFVAVTAGFDSGPDTITVNFGATAFANAAPSGFTAWDGAINFGAGVGTAAGNGSATGVGTTVATGAPIYFVLCNVRLS